MTTMKRSVASATANTVTATLKCGVHFTKIFPSRESDVVLWHKVDFVGGGNNYPGDLTLIIRRWDHPDKSGTGLHIEIIVFQRDLKTVDAHPFIEFTSKDFANDDVGFDQFMNFILGNENYDDDLWKMLISRKLLAMDWKKSKGITETFTYEPATKKFKKG